MNEDDVRVVVVDDVADVADALAAALELSGYKVWVAGDGAQALALVEKHRPHCVLLDVDSLGWTAASWPSNCATATRTTSS